MRQDRVTRAISAGPAFVLLLLVTAGLFMMHTLGHCGGHDPSVHGHGWAPMPPSAHIQAAMTAAQMTPGHQSSTQAGDRWPGKPVPFGSLAVCVAVLATLVLLVVTTLLASRTASWVIRLNRLTQRAVDMVRGPPAVPIGLLVADLSVARI